MPLSPPIPPAIALGIISEKRHFCKVQWIPFLSEATNQVPLFREWQWGVNPTRLSFLKTCRPTPSCLLVAWGPNTPRLKLWVKKKKKNCEWDCGQTGPSWWDVSVWSPRLHWYPRSWRVWRASYPGSAVWALCVLGAPVLHQLPWLSFHSCQTCSDQESVKC